MGAKRKEILFAEYDKKSNSKDVLIFVVVVLYLMTEQNEIIILIFFLWEGILKILTMGFKELLWEFKTPGVELIDKLYKL